MVTEIKKAGFIQMRLTMSMLKKFPIWTRSKPKRTKWNTYKLKDHVFQYRIIVAYHQTVMSYEFIVPKKGVADTEADWDDCFRCEAALELDNLLEWEPLTPPLTPLEIGGQKRKAATGSDEPVASSSRFATPQLSSE